MPPDIAEKIAAIGRVIAPPQTGAIYAPLHPKEPYAGMKVTRDVKYGPADLNVLDIFNAENAGSAPRPILVHVHGGGFSGGNKKVANSPFTDNIPLWAAKNGMIGLNINYRLAPAATWPSGAEDLAATIRWIKANAASFGGDPSRIYLLGWSAGGGHVASYLAFPQFHVSSGGGIAGAIFLSASPFDTTTFDMTAYKAYFGDDASKYAERSPMPGLLKSQVPMLVAYAGFDPPGIEKGSIEMIDRLCQAKHCPTKVFLKTHSHMSEGDAIGTDDTELTDQIAAFVKAGKPTN
jgi:triacylglycerol lipase